MKSRPELLLMMTLLSAFVAWCSSGPVLAGSAALPAASASAPAMTAADVSDALRPPGSTPNDDGPSPVVFPEQVMPLRFDHQKHVKQLGMSCTTCHGAAKTSQKSAESLLPPATRCDGCHGTNHRNLSAVTSDEPRALGQCSFCHLGYDPKKPNQIVVVLPDSGERYLSSILFDGVFDEKGLAR